VGSFRAKFLPIQHRGGTVDFVAMRAIQEQRHIDVFAFLGRTGRAATKSKVKTLSCLITVQEQVAIIGS